MNERPLVAFTLLSQTAVGAFLTLGALDVWAHGARGDGAIDTLTDGLAAHGRPDRDLALLSSLLHLGTPRIAWRAVANLRTSWLSREDASCAVLFAGLACRFRGGTDGSARGGRPGRSIVAVSAGVSGVMLVYAMARVYRLRTVPGWNTPLTTVSFFATTLMLGTLGAALAIALLPGVPDAIVAGPLHWIALSAAVCFAVEVAIEERGTPHRLRRILLLLGLGLTGVQVLSAGRATFPLALAFGVAVVTQTLGRYRFYVAGLRRTL